MKNLFISAALIVLFAGVLGCTGLEPIETREAVYGKASPLIHKSYAAARIREGDTWKVYLNASDPDGDMKYIVCTVDQPGVGVYPASFTRIGEGQRKELSGFLYLNTAGFEDLTFLTLVLTVQIQDMAGHFSPPAAFPLQLTGSDRQEPPSGGEFEETNLGPIMIRLRSIHNDMGPPFDRGLFLRGIFR
jgi:hypothetical protein